MAFPEAAYSGKTEEDVTQERAEALLRDDIGLVTNVLFRVKDPSTQAISHEFDARGRRYHASLVRPGPNGAEPELMWETPSHLGPDVQPVTHRLTVPRFGHPVYEVSDPTHIGVSGRLARLRGNYEGPRFRRATLTPYQLLAIAFDFNQERFIVERQEQPPQSV